MMQRDAEKRLAQSADDKKRPVGHHPGDYIPPEVLEDFLTGPKKKKPRFEPISEDNKGFEMLQKMGWNTTAGLGAKAQGRLDPIEAQPKEDSRAGLGVAGASAPTYQIAESDDIYEQYKKRMMLGYRYRPNPLNNPRKQYY